MRDDVSAARHAVGRTRTVWGGVVKAVAVVAAVAVVSTASVVAYAAHNLDSRIAAGAVDIGSGSVPGIAAIDGAFNVLLIGADNAAGQHTYGRKRDGTLNDVNIVVHVSADHRDATVLSLPRDLMIPHPECTDPTTGARFAAMSSQPLNDAYGRGGASCVVGTIEALTGLNIPYAAVFSFDGTVRMADAVGGVPICVNRAIDDDKAGLHLPAGRSVVTGRTALAYLRSRHGVGNGSDLSRIGSQQAYMSSLLRKMTSSSTLSDPTKLYGLANAAADNVKLSQSLAKVDTIVQMALALKKIRLDRMVFVQYPVVPYPLDVNKVQPNQLLAPLLVERIQRDKRVALDARALGVSTELKSKKASAKTAPESATAGPSKRKDKAVIAGLQGQTAAQKTCSIAN